MQRKKKKAISVSDIWLRRVRPTFEAQGSLFHATSPSLVIDDTIVVFTARLHLLLHFALFSAGQRSG